MITAAEDTPPATETRFQLFFVMIINFIDNNIVFLFLEPVWNDPDYYSQRVEAS